MVYKNFTILLAYYYLTFTSKGISSEIIPVKDEPCEIKMLHFTPTTRSILLLDLENEDTLAKTCIIKDFGEHDQMAIIFTGLSRLLSQIEIMNKFLNIYSNYLVVVNKLDPMILNAHIKNFLKSKWTYHSIVITTTDPEEECYKDGQINEDLLIRVEAFLNDLWYKFRIIYVTLSFPYVCPHHYFTYDKKKPSGGALYNRTIKILSNDVNINWSRKHVRYFSKDYPLRANLFNRFPTAIKNCDNMKYYLNPKLKFSGGYCGLDGIVMSNLVNHFQFNVTLTGSDDFGYVEDNGVTSGSLKNVLQGEVEVSFSSRFVVPYVSKGISFLPSIWYDCLCIFVRRPNDRPIWLFPIESYGLRVWLLMLLMMMVLGFVSWVTNIILKKQIGYSHLKMHSLAFHIWDTTSTISLGFFIEKKPVSYLLKGICLIYSVVHIAMFQGHTNYVFTTRIPYANIKSLEEIHQLGTRIYVTPGAKKLISPPYNEIQEAVFKNNLISRPANESTGFRIVLQTANTACVSRMSDASLETIMSYSDEDKEPLLTSVNECFRCYSAAYICTEGYLFEEPLRWYIQQTIEAGLPTKYYAWTQHSLHIPEKIKSLSNRPRAATKVQVSELRIGFILLLTGYVVSFIVFSCEIDRARKRISTFTVQSIIKYTPGDS